MSVSWTCPVVGCGYSTKYVKNFIKHLQDQHGNIFEFQDIRIILDKCKSKHHPRPATVPAVFPMAHGQGASRLKKD